MKPAAPARHSVSDTEPLIDRILPRMIPFGRPIIEQEERNAVLDALDSPILAHGPRGKQFEVEFAKWTGAPEAVAVSSCTAGMHLVYCALGLGPGHEVIVPALTHTATAHSVELTGARAVFVDAEIETGNIDLDHVELAITPKTRAIAIVHYLGMPVDMARVMDIARRHELFVLEDCALAIGTRLDGVHAGLHGDVGVFSFYPVKHMTTAEGGMILARDPEFAARLRLLRAFGVDRGVEERKTPGIYDVVDLGLNYRMNELQAAIGIEQLKKMNRFLAQRADNYATLSKRLIELRGLELFRSAYGRCQSAYYCLSVVLSEDIARYRNDIIAALQDREIGTSVYYPGPVPFMTYYCGKYGKPGSRYPVAKRISNSTIAFPVGPHLGDSDMHVIADAVEEILGGL